MPFNKFAMLLTVFAANPALADAVTSGDLAIHHPMAFETPRTAMSGGGYMMIENRGADDDRLIGIKGDFPQVMIHVTEESDGIARMRHVEAVDIPAMSSVEFLPGGYHVMFMGLGGDPFEAGETVPATLVFEKAGEIDVEFHVVPRGTDVGGHPHHSGGHHDTE